MFSRARDTPPSHKGLIKGVTDNECVQAMIGDVKVAVAGLAQATQVRCSTVTKCDKNSYPTLPYPALPYHSVPCHTVCVHTYLVSYNASPHRGKPHLSNNPALVFRRVFSFGDGRP